MKLNLVLLTGLLLMGCGNLPLANSNDTEIIVKNLGQTLPVTAEAKIGQEIIELEVAKTPDEQALGLMYRESLPPNRGMLFNFEFPRYPSFWMKNVVIPLDMIFLYKGEVKAIIADVPPCEKAPCPIYEPNTLTDQVIELSGGKASQIGLKVGDKIIINSLSSQN